LQICEVDMNASKFSNSMFVVLLICAAAVAADEMPVTVELTEIHMCCGVCRKAVEKAVAEVEGAKVAIDEEEWAATVTAPDAKTAQAALNEIAKAGFSGKIEDEAVAKQVAFEEVKTPDGKVKKLTVSHIHNCCRGCANAIIEAIEGVDGVSSHTVEPKKVEVVVEGDFVAADLVKAICDAGFYPQVK
jgi:periplasmic mercuric ion binding protein